MTSEIDLEDVLSVLETVNNLLLIYAEFHTDECPTENKLKTTTPKVALAARKIFADRALIYYSSVDAARDKV